MANIASALKRARQTKTRTARNRAAKSRLKTARKALDEAIKSGDKAAAEKSLRAAISVVGKAAKSGVIHKNAVGRLESAMTRAVNAK
jgi:small subunit ribosomal protein S20